MRKWRRHTYVPTHTNVVPVPCHHCRRHRRHTELVAVVPSCHSRRRANRIHGPVHQRSSGAAVPARRVICPHVSANTLVRPGPFAAVTLAEANPSSDFNSFAFLECFTRRFLNYIFVLSTHFLYRQHIFLCIFCIFSCFKAFLKLFFK